MQLRRGGLAPVLLAGALLWAGVEAGTGSATPPPEQIFGLDSSAIDATNRRSPPLDVAAQMISRTGAETQRMGVSWRYVQREPGPMRWDRYDDEVAAIRAHGMRPLIMIHQAPLWASEGSDCGTKHCPPDAAHLDDWAYFAGEVALRYPDSAAIAIWNAPNTKAWWPVPGGVDPPAYARLFNWAAGRLHAVAPQVPLLFGDLGSHRFKDTQSGLSIPTFLKRFYPYVDRRVLLPGDGLAIHAYPSASEIDTLDGRFARVLGDARTARDAYDPAGAARKLWITESGITTSGDAGVTEAEQARALVNVTDAVATMPDVAALTLFTFVELRWNSDTADQSGYGIVRRREDGSLAPKKAYCALVARAQQSAPGCP